MSRKAVAKLGLNHVVITSVDRDDLADGGAEHFAQVIRAIRAATPTTTIEVLTPDFLRKDGAAATVVAARPDVFNHNLETVPSKYLTVRPGARYFASLRLLQEVKERDASMFTKSGIMVGLGEERNEVLQLMDDLRAADVDFLTIGQYLQPTRKHHEVVRFVTPDEFKILRDRRLRQGLPDGLGLAIDALLAPCRRGLRAPQGRPRSAARRIILTRGNDTPPYHPLRCFRGDYAVIVWLWANNEGGHGAMGILGAGATLAIGAAGAWCIAVAISRLIGTASARLIAHVLLTLAFFVVFSPVIVWAFWGSTLSDLPQLVPIAMWFSPIVAVAALADGTVGYWLGRGKPI